MALFRLLIVCVAFFASISSLPAVAAAPIVGEPAVIDGNIMEIHGARIRLFGVDAPDLGQTCRVDGQTVACGAQAAAALKQKIADRVITCVARDRDRYDRVLAVCKVAGEDLGAWLVGQGLALAYREFSRDYVAQEADAAAHKRGLWAGEFTPPHQYRAAKTGVAEHKRVVAPPHMPVEAQTECLIKGIIEAKTGAKIYYVPGARDYRQIQVDTTKDEHWFCTEMAARAAGWRRAKE